jgi:hypothetical protein
VEAIKLSTLSKDYNSSRNENIIFASLLAHERLNVFLETRAIQNLLI